MVSGSAEFTFHVFVQPNATIFYWIYLYFNRLNGQIGICDKDMSLFYIYTYK